MEYLYMMFIPKSKKMNTSVSNPEYPIPSVILEILACCKWTNNLLVSPGYLPKKSNTTNSFFSAFYNLESQLNLKPNTVSLGFLRGMGSVSTYKSYVDNQFSELKKTKCCFNPGLTIDYGASGNDHRKMVFFYSLKDCHDEQYEKAGYEIQPSEIEQFLNQIEVNALIIGSTNFNGRSYFGLKNGIFDKGEADIVFLAPRPDTLEANFYDFVKAFAPDEISLTWNVDIDSSRVERLQEQYSGSVFAKATYVGSITNPCDYLKSMLRHTLIDQME